MKDQTTSGSSKPTLPFSEEEIDALLGKIQIFMDQFTGVCAENLEQAEKVAEAIVGSHSLAWAAAIAMLRRFEKKPVAVSLDREASLHHRMVLVVSFVQGIKLCYETLGSGLYVQGAALLRQEMETIAALAEARRTGEVKKIIGHGQQVGRGNIPWEMNRLHGVLSSATHLTDPALLDRFYRSAARPDEGFEGRPVRLMPLYSEIDVRNLWACQTGLILHLCTELHFVLTALYGEGANDMETSAWNAAAKLLEQAGYLKNNA